jgi:two-component system, chemotaxis family, response regulator Rcp1
MTLQPFSERSRPAVVLLVEDNDDHVFLTRESFDDARLKVDMHHVEDGEQCMAFLLRQPPFQDSPRPDLILLDINMPRMDGFEVMQRIRENDMINRIPVVVLTTSADHLDVNRMYELRCSSYMIKPVNFENFTQGIRQLADYWLTLVVLPRHSDE